MRRKDCEVTDFKEIEKILKRCTVCRIGFSGKEVPYIVPMNFGYTLADGQITFYFHCAQKGRKMELLQQGGAVSFELDCGHAFLPAKDASETSYAYESIMGVGILERIEERDEKLRGLNLLMKHYTNIEEYAEMGKCVDGTAVLRLTSREFSGKRHFAHPGKDPDSFEELRSRAASVLRPRKLSETAESGGVGAALLTEAGNIYVGVCIDTACSMGFCAEHAAAAAMITAGENQVVRMVAVDWEGKPMPPCGRCREFISQLHPENKNAEVMVNADTVRKLSELLPFDWK